MTMHLLPAYFTTTRDSRKSKPKSTKLSKHDAWLMSKGLHPAQIAAKKSSKGVDKKWRAEYNESMKVDRSDYVSTGMSGQASCSKPDEKIYTGGNLLGIATMHKSNMVPIFKASDAEDIARMRRG